MISAYIPNYNNAATVRLAIDSIRNQTVPVSELFVIDDGSCDNSVSLVEAAGVEVIRNPINLGRGAVRAAAMLKAQHELVLCLDAGKVLASDFIEMALPWFDDPKVAALCGRIVQRRAQHLAERWRGRHLLKVDEPVAVTRKASFATWGAIVRKSLVLELGNYNANLRHSEDKELGDRLAAAGYDVISDPRLEVSVVTSENMWGVLERYWRWHAGPDELVSWRSYLKQISYSIKVLVPRDIAASDPLSVPVSLLVPHYQFWRSWLRRHRLLPDIKRP